MKKSALALTAALLTSTAAFAQDEIKIGAVVTMSGSGAAWGQAILHGAELAAKEANDAGGLKVGDKTYKVSVIPYDDKYQAGEAVTAINRLAFQDEVKFVVGPVGSAPALAIQPITERGQMLMMTMAFSEKALGPSVPLTFRANVTTVEFAQPQVDWFVKKYGIKKVGSLFPNDETGQQVSKDVEKAYKNAGVELAAKEFYERERVDFIPLLTRIIGENVDAIELNINAPASAGLIVKQLRELGFKGHIIRTGGPATQDIINVAGAEATEGMLVHALVDPSLSETKAYMEKYAATYQGAMNGYNPAFYDATGMLLQAIASAGTIDDATKVAEELAAIKDYPGASGKLSVGGEATYGINRQIQSPFYVAEVVGGAEVIRARCSVADGCVDVEGAN
jgi:ABC-type branched-chain amino acid transport systems, periplasmic component